MLHQHLHENNESGPFIVGEGGGGTIFSHPQAETFMEVQMELKFAVYLKTVDLAKFNVQPVLLVSDHLPTTSTRGDQMVPKIVVIWQGYSFFNDKFVLEYIISVNNTIIPTTNLANLVSIICVR